jgi:hypothetical protein
MIGSRFLGSNHKDLTLRQKLLGQLVVASLFAYFGTKFADKDGFNSNLITAINSQRHFDHIGCCAW